MIVSVVIVLIICYVALYRPVIGVGIYLLLHNSIFSLAERLYAPMPKGSYMPIYACLFLGALFHARKHRRREPPSVAEEQHTSKARRILNSALLPYLTWLICASLLALPTGVAFRTSIVTFLTTSALPFILAPVAFLLRDQRAHLTRIAIVVALLTAVIQVYVSANGSVSLMYQAYFWSGGEIDQYSNAFLEYEGRGVPYGMALMVFTGVFAVATILAATAMRRRTKGMWLMALASLVAVLTTISRGSMLTLLVGCLCAVAMTLAIRRGRSRVLGRVVATSVFLVAAVLCALSLYPPLAERWSRRLSNFGSETGTMFEQNETNTRGLENTVAMNLLRARPYVGWGSMDIMLENTLIEEREFGGRDVHSLLKMGLIGGVPLMLLAVWMYLRLLASFWRLSRGRDELRAQLIPFLSVVVTGFFFNLVGLSRIFSAEAGPFALFVGLLGAYYASYAPRETEPPRVETVSLEAQGAS